LRRNAMVEVRIISWADYVPADLIDAFRKENGIDVEVTFQQRELISPKLRPPAGMDYDLAQTVAGPDHSVALDSALYSPIDMPR